MIKLVFALRRLPHLSRAQFQQYWREEHGPLVAKFRTDLRIRRYVQVHTAEQPVNELLRSSRGAPEPFDGVAELWWDSLEDLAAALEQPAGREAGAALLEDERRFVDHARSPLWVGEEHVVIDG
jgi:uncharacterized protein (TIGR02118 family)